MDVPRMYVVSTTNCSLLGIPSDAGMLEWVNKVKFGAIVRGGGWAVGVGIGRE